MILESHVATIVLTDEESWTFDASHDGYQPHGGPPAGEFRPEKIAWSVGTPFVTVYANRIYTSGKMVKGFHYLFNVPFASLPGFVRDALWVFTGDRIAPHKYNPGPLEKNPEVHTVLGKLCKDCGADACATTHLKDE
jgi:hypothetical protein